MDQFKVPEKPKSKFNGENKLLKIEFYKKTFPLFLCSKLKNELIFFVLKSISDPLNDKMLFLFNFNLIDLISELKKNLGIKVLPVDDKVFLKNESLLMIKTANNQIQKVLKILKELTKNENEKESSWLFQIEPFIFNEEKYSIETNFYFQQR